MSGLIWRSLLQENCGWTCPGHRQYGNEASAGRVTNNESLLLASSDLDRYRLRSDPVAGFEDVGPGGQRNLRALPKPNVADQLMIHIDHQFAHFDVSIGQPSDEYGRRFGSIPCHEPFEYRRTAAHSAGWKEMTSAGLANHVSSMLEVQPWIWTKAHR